MSRAIEHMWMIRAERDEYRYSALIDGERVGHAAWVQVGDLVVVPHVYVDAPYRATGLDLDLVRAICGDARDEALTVLAGSVFMERFAYLHPHFGTVLRTPYPGESAILAPLIDAAVGYEEARLSADWAPGAGA